MTSDRSIRRTYIVKLSIVRAGTLALTASALIAACSDEDNGTGPKVNPVVLTNRSVTPVLLKSLVPDVQIFSLVSSDDTLPQSPSFIFGGSADGTGLLRNTDGTFTALVNHEDNFSVSRISFDSTFKPVKGEYVVNSTFGKYRLCSSTLATVEEHGFGPMYITAGESNEESQVLGVNPFAAANSPTYLTGLGRWNTENAVPLPKTAYAGKTVLLLGDDDSNAAGGQVVMYVSNTVGDLDNGKLYALARNNDNVRERDMVVGQTYPVTFREIANHKTLTGSQLNTAVTALKAMAFGRVEDIDYRKDGTGREAYFTVTGQNNTGVNADYSRAKYGRVYRIVLDAADPTKGNLEVILDGDDRNGPAKLFQNPDNIFVGTNYVYVQEDDNGYGDETHDAYIYQYNIATKELKPVLQLDHRRSAADAAKYNAVGARAEGKAGWEYGAMIDISTQTGSANTFMISLQPHSWRAPRYVNPDGGAVQVNENQASQLVVVKGLPR